MSIQLNEVRAQVEKVIYEKKEAGINLDALKAQNVELTNELNAFKVRYFQPQSIEMLSGILMIHEAPTAVSR